MALLIKNIEDIWGWGDVTPYVLGEFLHIFMGGFSKTRADYLKKVEEGCGFRLLLGIGPDRGTHYRNHQKLLIGLRIDDVLRRVVTSTKTKEGYTRLCIYSLNFKLDILKCLLPAFPYKLVSLGGVPYSYNNHRDYITAFRCNPNMVKLAVEFSGCDDANKIGYIVKSEVYDRYIAEFKARLKELLSFQGYESYEEYYTSIRRYPEKYGRNDHLINMINCCINVKRDVVFYLPNFVDNRGRQYISSPLSPTYNKYARKILGINNPKAKIPLERSVYYQKISKYFDMIDNSYDSEMKYYLIVLFIELSKDYIKASSEKYFFDIVEFIEKGLELHSTWDYNNYNRIVEIIDNILKYRVVDKEFIVYRDATASGLQNFGIFTGYRAQMLEYINLQGNKWCDTYQYLVNSYVSDADLQKRKYWKKTIMTIPYNASWYTCYKYFKNSLEDDFDTEIVESFDIDENVSTLYMNKKNLNYKDVHRNFYTNIKKDLKNVLYTNCDSYEDKMIKYRYLKRKLVSQYTYKIQYRGFRDKYLVSVYDSDDDEKSSRNALEANNLHNLDSTLVRYLLKRHPLITIHDCFGIPLCIIHEVMDDINDYYSHYVSHEYSLFIIK